MDLIVGKNGYGVILVLVERNTSYCIIEKLPHGKNAKAIAKAVIRLLYAYKLTGVLTITTDNGSEFAAHQDITKALNGVIVYFADSYCSWQKGLVENTNKLIRQYIPKGTDFSSITPHFIKKVQAKLNRRPREKLNYSTPTIEFFKHFSQYCICPWTLRLRNLCRLPKKKMTNNFFTTLKIANFAFITMNQSYNGRFKPDKISIS